jgi:parvulin-like peptidyl-prolyl isomerase
MRFAFLAASLLALPGCDDDRPAPPVGTSAAAPASARPLTSAEAAEVLAEVGRRTITLGEYVASLERMDAFERLRYQSPARRRQLLDEMIDVELLAAEARRRGLDREPATQERMRQMLREELLDQVREQVPNAAEIPAAEVRRYYDEHRSEFREPERRRVAHIAVATHAVAEKVLAQAKQADAAEWGRLVARYSVDRSDAASTPLELKGDLGIVSGPGAERGDNPKVPEPLRNAVFELDGLGSVYDKVVPAAGKFHVVRLTGRSAARARSFREAERAIRVTLATRRLAARQEKLIEELKQRFPVEIDEAALAKVSVPKADPPRSKKPSHAPAAPRP